MLTGEIKINDFLVSNWTATNEYDLANGMTAYEVRITGTRENGGSYEYDFQVYHDRQRGAEYLTMVILRETLLRLNNFKDWKR